MFKVILLSIVLLTSSGKSNKPELNTLDDFWRVLGGDFPKKEVKFRWDWHLDLCKEQLRLDKVLNQRVMIELNGKNGSVRCPISQFWPGKTV